MEVSLRNTPKGEDVFKNSNVFNIQIICQIWNHFPQEKHIQGSSPVPCNFHLYRGVPSVQSIDYNQSTYW